MPWLGRAGSAVLDISVCKAARKICHASRNDIGSSIVGSWNEWWLRLRLISVYVFTGYSLPEQKQENATT